MIVVAANFNPFSDDTATSTLDNTSTQAEGQLHDDIALLGSEPMSKNGLLNECMRADTTQLMPTVNNTRLAYRVVDSIMPAKQLPLISRRTAKPSVNASDYKTIRFVPYTSANAGRALKVHVVLVYNEDQNQILRNMPVTEYKKMNFLFRIENKQTLDIHEFYLVPGQPTTEKYIPITNKDKLINTYVIALAYDRDVPATEHSECVAAANIVRKTVLGSDQNSTIILDKYGIRKR
jgi:hypothetical protein